MRLVARCHPGQHTQGRVDPDATFEFVPRTRDVRGMDRIPFDVRGCSAHIALVTARSRCCWIPTSSATSHCNRWRAFIQAADLPHDDDQSSTGLAPGVLAIFDGTRDDCDNR